MATTSARQQAWLGFFSFSALYSLPVHAASASAQLTTFSKFPTESIGRLTASTATTGTHTVVTSGAKTTTVPILPDHAHGCYFCPTDVGGLILSGFTAPGVYPSHSPSGFPSAFPEITIDTKGDPSFKTAASSTKASQASSTAAKSTGTLTGTKTSSVAGSKTSNSVSVSKSTEKGTSTRSTDSAALSKTSASGSGTKTTASAERSKTSNSAPGSKTTGLTAGTKSTASVTTSETAGSASGTKGSSPSTGAKSTGSGSLSASKTTSAKSTGAATGASKSSESRTGTAASKSTGLISGSGTVSGSTTLSSGLSGTGSATPSSSVSATGASTRSVTTSGSGTDTRSSTASGKVSNNISTSGVTTGSGTGGTTASGTGPTSASGTGIKSSSTGLNTPSNSASHTPSNTGVNSLSNTATKSGGSVSSTKTSSLGPGEVLTTLTAPETTTLTETVTGTAQGKSNSVSPITTITTTYTSGQVITVGAGTKSTGSQPVSASSTRSNSVSSTSSNTRSGTVSSTPSSQPSASTSGNPSKTSSNTGSGTSRSTDAKTTTSALPIITVFPTESPGTISSTVTKPGKTTETESDGHTVILPVLPKFGSDNGLCWFCPPSGGGFVLSGFPKPGVYPTGNLPGFPTPIPQITIGPDLTPTFSQEPPKSNQPTQSNKPSSTDKTSDHSSSTTSSECSKSAAPQCQVVTSFKADQDGKTTATTTITSCVTQTGCSVQGSTSASATTTTASGCWQYAYSNDDDSISSDDNKRKRMPINALGHRTIQRRYPAETVNSVGNCQFQPQVTTPAYPDANKLEAANGASYWYVPTTAVLNNKKCPVVTMTQFANTKDLTANPVIREPGSKGVTYIIGGTKNPSVNVDHVYELSLFKGFMESVVNSGKFTCNDFESFFLAQDPNSKTPRYQVLLDQLPSDIFPDFAGMDAVINVRKGQMFNEKLKGLPNAGAKDFTKRLQFANEMGAAVAFVNSPDIAKLFKSTNSRIYDAFLGIDALIEKGCGKGVTPDGANGKWADAYSSYMTSVFADRNQKITYSIRSYIKSGNGDPASFTDGVDAFKAQYPEASWAWDEKALLDWSNKSPKNIGKRDAEVCSLSSAQSTATSVSASTTKGGSSTAQPTKTSAVTSKPTSTLVTTTSKPNSTSIEPTSKTSQEPKSTSQKPSSTPSSSTPVSKTSSTPTINTSAPSCAPTSGAGVSTIGMEQAQAQANINSFCSILKDLGGCQTDEGDVIITNLTAACAGGAPYISNLYYNTGDTMYLNVSLAQGSSYRITEDTCTKAFGTVLNGCAPFVKGDDGFLRKYGGSIGAVENDAAALFEITHKAPTAIS